MRMDSENPLWLQSCFNSKCNTPEFPTPKRNQNRKRREEIRVLHKEKEKNLDKR